MFNRISILAVAIPLMAFVAAARAQSGRGRIGSTPPSDLPPGVFVPSGDLAQDYRTTYPTFQGELGVNDADFAVIVSKLDAIGKARNQIVGDPRVQPIYVSIRVLQQGQYNRRLGIIQPPPPWQNMHLPPTGVALYELNDALNDPNTPPEVIKAKLENLRAVRAKFEADLRIAYEALRAILNQKQEAIMVNYGYLD
jgi:hypothetical protein